MVTIMTQGKNQDVYTYDQLKHLILPLIRKYHASSALLFGSYARNEATENSDIDLVIIGGEDFLPADVFSIAEDLHVISGKAVDVYELRELNKGTPFYNRVLREGVTIQ